MKISKQSPEYPGLRKHDYQFAIDVQNACNLSGLVFAFARIMAKINIEARQDGHGTDWVNNHPICRLFAEQISFLTSTKNYDEAFDECEKNSK